MAMTILVTRNASGRIRGFLASCACELAPGVYTVPRMSDAVRERVWNVLVEWTAHEADCSVVMTWPDRSQPSGQSLRILGAPACDLVEVDGMFFGRRPLSEPDLQAEPSTPQHPTG